MMGPYFYYDASYSEDCSAELHIHDCMWSGECYSCQPTRVTFSNASICPGSNGTVPITVGGTGYITLTATRQETHQKLAWPIEKCTVKLAENSSESDISNSSQQLSPERSPAIVAPEKPIRVQGKKTNSTKSNFSSSDNKKLRHREVEKNRHRQLQAMVKTLSEKIPGRLDKETQVQTMKRAARYCVFLRDVMDSLSNGHPVVLKENLEEIYLKSCDKIENIMSQHMSAR